MSGVLTNVESRQSQPATMHRTFNNQAVNKYLGPVCLGVDPIRTPRGAEENGLASYALPVPISDEVSREIVAWSDAAGQGRHQSSPASDESSY